MDWCGHKYVIYFFILLAAVVLGSCKTDEFKFGEIAIKEDWAIDVVSPLFVGNGMEFRDFIYDWKKITPTSPAPFTVLEYSNESYKTIPTDLIFTPSAIIDSFPFYIQGSYSLTRVELMFSVKNSCPFPLNLQLQFFDKQNPSRLGPVIIPPAFGEANFDELPVVPSTTVHHYLLDSLQLQSFNNSDRIKFTSWYGTTEFIFQNDTVFAHHPVDLSIKLIGVVQGKDED
jgi:hypothetical protein